MNYKDAQDNLYSIEPEFEHLLPQGCTQITSEEAEAIRISKLPVVVPPTTAQIKAAKWEEIKAKRDLMSDTGGYPVTIPHTVITNTVEIVDGVEVATPVETIVNTVKWFHSDGKSKTQQLGLARKADRLQVAGGNMSAPFAGPGPGGTLPWKTMDGSYELMTGTLAQAIVDAAEQQDMALFAVASYHGAMVMASATPETYNFSGGWPATYQS